MRHGPYAEPSALRLAGRCVWSWLSHPLVYGLVIFYGSILLGLWGGGWLG